MTTGKLYLIPTVISEETQERVIPRGVLDILPGLGYFLAENVRTARRFLSSLKIFPSIEPLRFTVLDKDTRKEALAEMFAPVFLGENIGLLSESGCPGVADPGALAVEYAHENNIEVVPLVGPSSILLALMGSGLNGQKFSFHGYLPVQEKELRAALKELEQESVKKNQTQIFIETPYRNNRMISTILKVLHPDTRLTVAQDLTGRNQQIRTLRIKDWRAAKADFPKVPVVFLFLAN